MSTKCVHVMFITVHRIFFLHPTTANKHSVTKRDTHIPTSVHKINRLNRNCCLWDACWSLYRSILLIDLCVPPSKPSSRIQSHKVRSLLLCPREPCRWGDSWRVRSPCVFHWPPRRWLRWLNCSPVASLRLRQAASCPWCRPVSRSWRRGGRRRHRTSKQGGSKWEPGSHIFPWSSTGWCEWRPGQTASVK